MTTPIEVATTLILEEDLPRLERLLGTTISDRQVGTGILAVNLPENLQLQADKFIRVHYLDRYVLLYPPDLTGQNRLSGRFFELIASEYRALVDVPRNEENIAALLQLVIDNTRGEDQLPILDFGCGIGLSLPVAARMHVRIEGVDKSPAMRSLARRTGLHVLGSEDGRDRIGEFRGAIASYVLHYSPSVSDLANAWELVRPGGVFAANLHKGAAVERTGEVFRNLGALVHVRPPMGRLARHGPYLIATKRD